jgi:hypothetical protein
LREKGRGEQGGNGQEQWPYTDLIYQPMLEVMKYLRQKSFRTYIVTVVGSSIVTKYEDVNGKPELMREPKVSLIDDGPGRAIGINLFIEKRPYAAFGNPVATQRGWNGRKPVTEHG